MLEFLNTNQLLNMNLVQNVTLELFKKVFFFNLIIPSAEKKEKKTKTNKQFYLKE